MQAWRTWILIGAVMTTAHMAGIFAFYSHTVMPALRTLDDRAFIAAFQALDRSIINPWFLATAFLGALATTALAAVVHLGRPALPWIAAALGLYLVAVAVTLAVHVPLNDAIKAAGDPARLADPALTRAQFQEGRWVAWNAVRVVASFGSLGCLCAALVRSTERWFT